MFELTTANSILFPFWLVHLLCVVYNSLNYILISVHDIFIHGKKRPLLSSLTFCFQWYWIHLLAISPFSTKDITFMNSCVIRCTSIYFGKGVYLTRKKLLSLKELLPLKVYPFLLKEIKKKTEVGNCLDTHRYMIY